MIIQIKKCSTCKQEKSNNEFYASSHRCKLCESKRKKEEYQRRIEHRIKNNVDFHPELKDKTQKCLRCEILKPLTEFYIRKDSQKPRGECKKCWTKRNNERFREYHINYGREHRAANPQKYAIYCRKYKLKHPERILLRGAKSRAKTNNIEFNINELDIIIPEFCPILGIKLEIAEGRGPKDNSPSLDRINNNLGYIKGNVRVISFRANSLKKDGTIEEFQAILKDMLDGRVKIE